MYNQLELFFLDLHHYLMRSFELIYPIPKNYQNIMDKIYEIDQTLMNSILNFVDHHLIVIYYNFVLQFQKNQLI